MSLETEAVTPTTTPGAPHLASEMWVEAPPNSTPTELLPHPSEHHHHIHHHTFLQAFQSLVYVLVVALFIITFTVQPFRIPTGSMEPTLLVGDFLLVDKEIGVEVPPQIFAPTSHIHRGDLIVFHYPVDASMHLVKRVVGLPGDHIRLHDGHVLINDQPLAEPYAMYLPASPDAYRDDFPHLSSADPGVDSRWWIQMHTLVLNGELTIPPDSFFVLGDNRNDSKDSRYWGLVPRAAIIGKPFLIYFSLNNSPLPPEQLPITATSGIAPSPSSSTTDFARWNRALHIIH